VPIHPAPKRVGEPLKEMMYVVPFQQTGAAPRNRVVATVPVSVKQNLFSDRLDFDIAYAPESMSGTCYSLVVLEKEEGVLSGSAPAVPALRGGRGGQAKA
jgi:hypothetical protein